MNHSEIDCIVQAMMGSSRLDESDVLDRYFLFDKNFSSNNILELYNNEPKLFEINNPIDPLEEYNKSIKYDKEFLKNKDNQL